MTLRTRRDSVLHVALEGAEAHFRSSRVRCRNQPLHSESPRAGMLSADQRRPRRKMKEAWQL
jgi:hypothetical protein